MSRLVADLLLLAQADAGQHLTLRPLDVSAILREAARTARLLGDDALVGASAIPDGLQALGHAGRLRQVILILLDNAVKHTPAGGTVRLSTGVLTAPAADVSSDAPANPLGEQERIFERFYRAPRTRSDEGDGLGLAIAHWIVQEHHGSIGVESAPGQGAVLPATGSIWPARQCDLA